MNSSARRSITKFVAALAVGLSSLAILGCPSPSHELKVGSNTIQLFPAPAEFQAKEQAVLETARETFERVSSILELESVTVEIGFNTRRAIPGYGVGGYTPSAGKVLVWIDPDSSEVSDLLTRRLAWILAHEMHHAARWRETGYGSTLLEAIVSEGLADHFALQVLGGPSPPWTAALSEGEILSVRPLATSRMNAESYDHSDWFFGGGSIPRWAGYTLGYDLVKTVLDSRPGSTAADLVDTPAEEFQPAWASQ